jgi:excisionase family DNA binding protein
LDKGSQKARELIAEGTPNRIEQKATLTAKEASKYLGISYWLLLEMCKRKELPHIKAGSRILFRVQSLDEWLLEQEAASLSKPEPVIGKIRRLK